MIQNPSQNRNSEHVKTQSKTAPHNTPKQNPKPLLTTQHTKPTNHCGAPGYRADVPRGCQAANIVFDWL